MSSSDGYILEGLFELLLMVFVVGFLQAADFEIYGTPNNEVFNWIKKNLMYDQMILEFWNPDEPNSGWIHVAYNPDQEENIKENLRAYKDEDNITRYKPIIGDA